ncbi:MAG: pyrroline-5-carboxylate reductase [SAR86 cluster bacterium]|uniref:Pyrroline-5-carboxylate reductase n=1 Tax=SAR86 cluster bacterium TaxID=2030880 RepID=A0A2A5B9G4_9GAMM|nr:MAG: pyrroline-5-carboxylate reductase [SAR86 cluster bacterium]
MTTDIRQGEVLDSTIIGFIGAGNMANSLIRGLLAKGISADSIWATDIDKNKLQLLEDECGIKSASSQEIAENADVVVLAVKPQVMADACQTLASQLGERCPLLVSIAAGITTARLQQWMGKPWPVVRCMPNTPALVGKGATGLFSSPLVSENQKLLAENIMSAVGFSAWVDTEEDIDTVTALSGSGPAYFFLFMEAMQNVAKDMGLSEQLARDLTYATAAGAAELAQQSEDDIAELRRKVTSPGGTTEQAINQFEEGGLRELVTKALQAARSRSIELAKDSDKK